jgi:two-component system OmpR family sensor kinase/two-component system sensor histidine kinase QseC
MSSLAEPLLPTRRGTTAAPAADAVTLRPWSLRRRVLLLTAAITAVAWLVGGTAMFMVSRHVSDSLFDQRLRDVATTVLTFADHEVSEVRAGGAEIVHFEGALTIGTRYHYQIWSKDGELLLVSVDTVGIPFVPLDQRGLSTVEIEGTPMRVIVLSSDDGSKVLEVVEPLSTRAAGINPDFGYLVIPLLLSLALLVGLSTWLVRRATWALGESARQVTQRSPDDLRPLAVADPPQELTPIVAAINSLFARIENALATERRFTSAAAHELRTPLAAIKIQAQVALLTRTDADRRQALSRLMLSIDGAAHMIDQLLTMSRLDGLIALRAQAVRLQLDAVSAHVIDEMRPLAARRQQSIIEELAAADIEGLEFGVAVLLRNLVDNAARYGPSGGTIRVSTGMDEGFCFVRVEDAGPGIAPEQRQRVFERFYRLPTNSMVEGCGIGLSIVQTVAELHHARIELDRSSLGGLCVTVLFPAAGDPPASQIDLDVPAGAPA